MVNPDHVACVTYAGSNQCWLRVTGGGGEYLFECRLDEVAHKLVSDYDPALMRETG